MMRWLLHAAEKLMGRRRLWRLGRALYLQARAGPPNDLRSNGERVVQQHILSIYSSSSEKLVIFDVGANVGDWTISMLNLASASGFSNIEIHAFEPVPSTFALLSKRIAVHPLSGHVKLVQAALSSLTGGGEMYVYSDCGETNSLYYNPTQADHPKIARVVVEKKTIRDYCANLDLGKIGLLKCDAEGHDMEILIGARELLARERVTVFQFEYNEQWIYSRHFLKDVFDFVHALPYMLGKITPTHIEFYDEWHPELERYFQGNYVLMHRESLCRFAHKRVRLDKRNTYA